MNMKNSWILILLSILFLLASCAGDDDPGSSPGQAPKDDDDDNDLDDDDDDNLDDDDDDDDNDDDAIPTLGQATVAPDRAPAFSRQNFVVEYLAGTPIAPGGGIKIFFGATVDSKSYFPCMMTTDDKKDCGYTTVESDNPAVTLGLSITMIDPHPGVRLWAAVVAVEEGTLQPGDKVTLHYGVNEGKAATQQIAQEVEVTVLVSPDEKGEYAEIEHSPILTVTPLDPAKLVTALGLDSGMLKLSVVDPFSNHVSDYSGQADIKLIDESGNETELGVASLENGVGAFALPSLSDGYYLIESRIKDIPLESRAPLPNGAGRVFYGDIHVHTKFSDSYIAYDPLETYEYAKNVALIDFVSLADHAECVVFDDMFSQFLSRQNLGNLWEATGALNEQFNQDGMTTLNGYEVTFMTQTAPRFGHMNAYFRNEQGNLYTFTDQAPEVEGVYSPDELWAKFDRDETEVLTIPHHTLLSNLMGSDFAYYNPKYMRLVEVYSHLGCSESKDAPFSVYFPQMDPDALGEVRRAIGPLHYRLGFIANSDNHFGHPAGTGVKDPFTRGLIGGLTAVVTEDLTRESLWTAMYNRSVYATTGERMYVEFSVNGQPMGQELYDQVDVTIEARAIGVRLLSKVQVIKYDDANGWQTLYEAAPLAFFWNDAIVDPAFTEDALYYLRVIQIDSHTAWSSPVWVNQSPADACEDRAVSPGPLMIGSEAEGAGKQALEHFWTQLGYL